MATGQAAVVLEHIHKLVAVQKAGELTDRELLERFSLRRDEAAFTEIVKRHGPMVLRTCRHVLQHTQDVEDAFQAAFLVLIRKAPMLRWQPSIAGWLHEAAYRLALKARRTRSRARLRESRAGQRCHEDPHSQLTVREAQALLDEELHRLPQTLRAPLVLCYLESATQDEAARQLGWSLSTLKRRLERGRALLHSRLTRRGLTLPSVLSLCLLTAETVSAALIQRTVKVAVLLKVGRTGGAISASLAALLKGGPVLVAPAKLTLAAVLAAGLFVAGLNLGAGSTSENPPPLNERQTSPGTRNPITGDESRKAGREHVDLHGDPLPAEALTRLGTVRFRHGDMIRNLGFMSDGKTLLSADWHGVHVWDAATGKRLRRFGDPGGSQFQSIAFSGDGRLVALTMSDGRIELWDAVSGRPLRQLAAGRFPAVVLSDDGKTLAVHDLWDRSQEALHLWDSASGIKRHQLIGHTDRIHNVVFSPDGKTLISASDDKSIRFWDVAGGRQVRQLNAAEAIGQLVLAPDGKTLASVGTKKSEWVHPNGVATTWRAVDTVVLWDVASGKETHRLSGHGDNGVGALVFTPDSKTLVSSDWRSTHWWDVASGKKLPNRGLPAGRAAALAFAGDGKTLALGGTGQTIRIFDVASGKERLGSGHQDAVYGGALSPDGRLLATAGGDNLIRLWDRATGKELRQLIGHDRAVWSVAFVPDGRTLVSSGGDLARAWDLGTGQELRRFPGSSAVLSPDGKVLVTVEEKTVRLWEVASGRELRQWQAPKAGLVPVSFSPDGRTLFSWGDDKMIRLWDVTTGTPVRQLAVEPFVEDGRVYCCAISPNGKLVAFGGQLDHVVLYDLTTGREAKRLRGSGTVSSLTFSPDGRVLASGDWSGGTIRLWEVATGQRFAKFVGHRGRVFGMAFSANGDVLLSASDDTTALVWDMISRHSPVPALALADLEKRWADLAGDDAGPARDAVRSLAVAAKQAIPFLEKQLPPIERVDPKHLDGLIADLNSKTFAVRARASAELEKLGERAEPALRQALVDLPSLEVRRRLQTLLDKFEQASSTHWLRTQRTLQVLEYAATPQARRMLQALANGAPGARLTREAAASLERLAKHPSPR